jgi:hypothetical protein
MGSHCAGAYESISRPSSAAYSIPDDEPTCPEP